MLNASENLDDASQMHAFYLLAGFGLEVAMKSWLRHLDVPDFPDLKKLGHDLVSTANALSDLLDDDDRLPTNLFAVVQKLGPAHLSLAMRYTPDEADFSLPHPSLVIEVISELVDGMFHRLVQEALA